MTDISGKRTLITGAAGGIGAMLAAELGNAGCACDKGSFSADVGH